MKINALTPEEVLRFLVTAEYGLDEEEARKRLAESGPNEITEVGKTPLIVRFLAQFTHFLALLLWIGAFLAFLSEYLHPNEGMLTLGIAIIGVILINAVFTFFQEYRAEKAFEALRKLLPFRVRTIRNGTERDISAQDIVPGDIIVMSEGDRVPADARILKSSGLKMNNASLTGESEPVPRTCAPDHGDLLESGNIVFAGTTVAGGSATAAVFATGMRTEFGRIAHLTGAIQTGLSPLQREIVKVTRIIALFATVMGVVFFAIGHAIGRSFWENFIFAIGIIVANVPEGLLPTVTLSLAMGSQRMAKRKALIKTLSAVETLGSVSVICTDKTGTLTQNRMTTHSTWVWDRTFRSSELDTNQHRLLLQAGALCTNATYANGHYAGDPMEAAILRTAIERIGEISAPRIHEIPFDADRKRMTTVNRFNGEIRVFTKGAPEHLIPLCSHIAAEGDTVLLGDEMTAAISAAAHAMMDSGLRVLAFACKQLHDEPDLPDPAALENGLIFLGLMGLEDPPRPEVPGAIGRCHDAGIKIIMITGDSSRTAVAIGREIGLIRMTPAVVEGHEFSRMSDALLREKLTAPEVIFSRMTPKHKMRVVTILKEEGERVAVTGDGVNDAPALKKADIGIAMGLAGTDVAKEAADMILLDDNFATIVNAVEEGRGVYENIRKFISYILSSNIPEIVPYLAYALLRIPLPLTIMQILAVDLGTDMLPALALGAEKPTADLMKQPPRSPRERLLNLRLLGRAYLFLGPIEAAACMFGFFWVLFAGGWAWGQQLSANSALYIQATTACLTAIIITQVANVFACRSFRKSVFSIGLFSNRLIFLGIAVEVLLQLFIVYHPLGNRIFGTAPLLMQTWLILIPFAFLLLGAEEMRKLFSRKTPAMP